MYPILYLSPFRENENMKFCKYLPALREVSRRGKGERSRRLADMMVFDAIGVESSLLLSGDFLVLLHRGKSTKETTPQLIKIMSFPKPCIGFVPNIFGNLGKSHVR